MPARSVSRCRKRLPTPALAASRLVAGVALAVSLLCVACGVPAPRQPAGVTPSPGSVTRSQPGGDAEDPHWAALQRQLNEPWARGTDRDNQLQVPLADAKNWKRVRFWLVDHFTGFRYGEDFHALNVVFVQEVEPGVPPTAEICLKRAEKWARPQLHGFDVRMGPIQTHHVEWRKETLAVRAADALVDYGFGPAHFSAAWVAYPAYPDACLMFAFAVPWREHRALAQQVRERWILEGVPRIKPKTETRPYRKSD